MLSSIGKSVYDGIQTSTVQPRIAAFQRIFQSSYKCLGLDWMATTLSLFAAPLPRYSGLCPHPGSTRPLTPTPSGCRWLGVLRNSPSAPPVKDDPPSEEHLWQMQNVISLNTYCLNREGPDGRPARVVDESAYVVSPQVPSPDGARGKTTYFRKLHSPSANSISNTQCQTVRLSTCRFS